MHALQSVDALDKHSPDLLLLEVDLYGLAFLDHLQQVAIISICHHYAQHLTGSIDKRFSIRDNVRVSNRGQDSHLVDSVLSIFCVHLRNIYFFQSVNLIVCLAGDLEHVTVGTLSYLLVFSEVV